MHPASSPKLSEYSPVDTVTGAQTGEDAVTKNVNIVNDSLAVAFDEDVWSCGNKKGDVGENCFSSPGFVET